MLLALRDGLRSGRCVRAGLRRYADPASYLFTPEQWEPQRAEFCQPGRQAGQPPTRSGRRREDELHTALADLETLLADGDDPARSAWMMTVS